MVVEKPKLALKMEIFDGGGIGPKSIGLLLPNKMSDCSNKKIKIKAGFKSIVYSRF